MPQLEAVKSNQHYTTSIEKTFLMRVQASYRVTKNLHVFDYRYHFVCIEVDIAMKWKLPIKDKFKVSPGIFGR